MRLLALVMLAIVLVPTPSQSAAQRLVVRFTGSIDSSNAAAFTKAVAGEVDKVIGLAVRIEPSQDGDLPTKGYIAEGGEGFLLFKRSSPDEGGIEIVSSRQTALLHGELVLDGFFVVKSGGMHQGTVSFGLEPTDEGAVRLNPALQIVEKAF